MVLKKISPRRYDELKNLVKGLQLWEELYQKLDGYVTSHPDIMSNPVLSDKTAEIAEEKIKYWRYINIIKEAVLKTPYGFGKLIAYSIINNVTFEQMVLQGKVSAASEKMYKKANVIFFNILDQLYSQ